MRWPRRSPRLPTAARAGLVLGRREHVLAAAALRDGSWLAATDQGLVQQGWRVAWSSATHAQWYDDATTLAVGWLDDSGEMHDRSFVLADPGLLPETVHERVVASIVLSRRFRSIDGGSVRVVARRQPGSDDVLWQVVPESGADLSSADVRAQVDQTLRAMSDELGL
jgi:hypothetical protein